MSAETHGHSPTSTPDVPKSGIALRFALSSGTWSVPLHRMHHLAGYATLIGEPEDYFLGWLAMRGELVPVFDLNLVVCDQPTPERFGSRIMVVRAAPGSPTPYIGLLAAGVTDTIALGAVSVEPLDFDTYLPMLYTLIPPVPGEPASGE
ncbi:MAG: chemotaxis protein CheW [Acidobacteriaceae bacterium]|jgi:chemotaxis signal transduction protein